jgi:protein-S-isoprenylcysteine O-methyltransferase Ste14
MSSIATRSTLSDPTAAPPASAWHRAGEFFLRRRVRLTAILFVVLIAEDVLNGIRPHGLLNVYDWKSMLGVSLVVGGLALRSWAAGILHKRTRLTTDGPYGIVRHPLYIGSYWMMLGFCFLIDDLENIWFVVGPVLVLYAIRAIREERTLADLFGRAWDAYARRVPRFLPRRWPRNAFGTWTLSRWRANREYNAVMGVVCGLAALQIWHLS